MLYQHITVNSSAINFTRLIPENVYVQAEGMLKPTETLVLIQHHVERILLKTNYHTKLSAPTTRRKLH